ncbi:chaplin [Streptomyces sp. NPDC019539]|uniref:chaplin n=1 Tax=Streptomyces sp. NPDC019539 TaxID=3365063 RepID=UPI0037B8A537
MATTSPGILSGNSLQAPVPVPANVCGTTLGVISLLNPPATTPALPTEQPQPRPGPRSATRRPGRTPFPGVKRKLNECGGTGGALAGVRVRSPPLPPPVRLRFCPQAVSSGGGSPAPASVSRTECSVPSRCAGRFGRRSAAQARRPGGPRESPPPDHGEPPARPAEPP